MTGRKRHLLVDSQGSILTAVVHPADIQDRDGAYTVLDEARSQTTQVKQLWADAAYRGDFVAWAQEEFGWTVEIVRRLAEAVGFVVQPRRWVVERTFAWLGRYRRLSKDYAEYPESSEAWINVAMSHILVRRLCPS